MAFHSSIRAAEIVRYDFQNNVLDQSGNGNHGTIQGAPTFGPGVSGTAINFNNPVGGVIGPDFVQLPNSAGILGLNNSSFSVAIRYRSTDTGQTNGRLFGGRDGSNTGPGLVYNASATPEAFGMLFSSSGSLIVGHDGGLVDPDGVTTDGDWHWSILTLDRGANTVRLYADDELIDTEVYGTLGTISFADLGIGRFNGSSPGDTNYAARNTTVQDFILYDTSLNFSEIQTLVNGPLVSAAVPEPTALLCLGLLLPCLRRPRRAG